MVKLVGVLISLNIAIALYGHYGVPPEIESALLTESNSYCYRLKMTEYATAEAFMKGVKALDGVGTLTATSKVHEPAKSWVVVSVDDFKRDEAKYRSIVPKAFKLSSGPYKGDYSLGVFNSMQNAKRHAGSIERQGLSVKVLPKPTVSKGVTLQVKGRYLDALINRYHFEFIEKKLCLGVASDRAFA